MRTLKADGTDRFFFHADRDQNGRYIIYPRDYSTDPRGYGRRSEAVTYRNEMITRDGKPCGPTWATADEIDALGERLFG